MSSGNLYIIKLN